MIRRCICAAALAAASSCASVSGDKLDSTLVALAQSATQAGTQDALRADLAYLADDLRAGRRTGSKGYLDAANYVAARFDAIGLEPGVDGRWFQDVRLRSATRKPQAAQLSIIAPGGRIDATHLKDFLIGRPMRAPEFSVTAPAVFVGYGVSRPEAGYDDYANLDVSGKIIVVFGGAPESFDSEERAHFGGGALKQRIAMQHGAAGMISLRTIEGDETTPWEKITQNATQPSLAWIGPGGAIDPNASLLPFVFLQSDFAERLFEGAPKSFGQLRALENEKQALPKFELAVRVGFGGASTLETTTSPNIVGMIEGSDRSLRNEVVVLSAHLDHLGVDEPNKDGGDLINNGAMDNAIGAAMLLEVAERLAAKRPKRSVVILATTAEEQGLLGADYFARHPTLGKKRIVADINLDMPLMLYPFTDVVAFGAERSGLGEIVKAEAEAAGLTLAPDPFPEEGVFTRSDHYAFVQQGVPSVFLIPGFANGGDKIFETFLAERYHEPSDDLSQPVDYDAAARFADLNYRIALRIANGEKAPSWKDGDFFGELFGKKN